MSISRTAKPLSDTIFLWVVAWSSKSLRVRQAHESERRPTILVEKQSTRQLTLAARRAGLFADGLRAGRGGARLGWCLGGVERDHGAHFRLEIHPFLFARNAELHPNWDGSLGAVGDRHQTRDDTLVHPVGVGFRAHGAALAFE